MTDVEILRGVGLNELLDNMDHMFTKGRVLKAMEQARADERVQAASDIQFAIINGDLPDKCEEAAYYIYPGYLDHTQRGNHE